MVQDGKPVDLLNEVNNLYEWLNQAGFYVESAFELDKMMPADEILRESHTYRRALRLAMQTITTTGIVPSEILHKTNQYLQRKNHWFELSKASNGHVLHGHWTIGQPEDICSPIAHSFAQFLPLGDLSRVRKCKNPDCVLYFNDTSKSGTREWCSLEICGNKLRVAAFRRRKAH
jgi:predicted RNA-binding Zn ribbon-like protein